MEVIMAEEFPVYDWLFSLPWFSIGRVDSTLDFIAALCSLENNLGKSELITFGALFVIDGVCSKPS
jgi:hypothetical protein